MTLVLLALPRVRHGLKAKGLMSLWICAVCVAVVLCIFDLQGAGILMRYICDFGLYFALAAALSFLELLQVRSTEPLSKGWTTQLGAHAQVPVQQAGAHAGGVGRRGGADGVGVSHRVVFHVRIARADDRGERAAVERVRDLLERGA